LKAADSTRRDKFKQIIDEFILSSTVENKQLVSVIRNIDHQAAKLGISFYQMMFMLIQKDSDDNRKRKKEWLIKE
jgi:hypothetical protein